MSSCAIERTNVKARIRFKDLPEFADQPQSQGRYNYSRTDAEFAMGNKGGALPRSSRCAAPDHLALPYTRRLAPGLRADRNLGLPLVDRVADRVSPSRRPLKNERERTCDDPDRIL